MTLFRNIGREVTHLTKTTGIPIFEHNSEVDDYFVKRIEKELTESERVTYMRGKSARTGLRGQTKTSRSYYKDVQESSRHLYR